MVPAEAELVLEVVQSRRLLPLEVAAAIHEVRGEPGCHDDPRMLRSARSYAPLVHQTMNIGLTVLTTFDPLLCSAFSSKKKGDRLGLIVDCRTTNAFFTHPPSLELL